MLDDYLALHAQSLKLRSQRTQLLASNIANADTPNYKARDLAFAEVLQKAGGLEQNSKTRLKLSTGSGLSISNPRHLEMRSSNGFNAQVMYRQPEEASLDGNTVDKDQEQARFSENTMRYQASLTFINSRISGLIRAIKGE